MSYNAIVMVLVGISVVGAIAIPFGDPQFLDRAIALELSFITLAVVILFGGKFTVRGYNLQNLRSMPAYQLLSL
jgi:uncharacterized membrane protein